MNAVEATIVTAAIGGVITLAVALVNKYKPKQKVDYTEILFARYEKDRKTDRADIEAMKRELTEVKTQLEQVRIENIKLREENEELREEIEELRQDAAHVAKVKAKEDKEHVI